MSEVRKATAADVDNVGAALARSFHDDPIMEFLFPAKNLHDRLRKFMTFEVGAMLRHDEVWTVADGTAGAALWAPPNKWRQSPGDMLRSMPHLLPLFSTRMPRALRSLTAIEKVHPSEPHYYLAVLGTEPASQGKGVGSALMAPVLERCDTEGLPAYLESSKEANLAFYARHGFEVVSQLDLPGGGPSVWPMRREPRTA